MKHYDQKASWRGKDLSGLPFHITLHPQKKSEQELKQGGDLEAGADAEAVVRGLLHIACSACFLKRNQDHQPRDGTTHNGLIHFPSVTKTMYALQPDLMEPVFSTEGPSLQITLSSVCV